MLCKLEQIQIQIQTQIHPQTFLKYSFQLQMLRYRYRYKYTKRYFYGILLIFECSGTSWEQISLQLGTRTDCLYQSLAQLTLI